MQTLDWVILPALAFFIFALLAEIRHYLARRSLPGDAARAARHRLTRRLAGILIVFVIIALVRYPWLANTHVLIKLSRLTVALLLCFILFLIALMDFNALRRETQNEFRALSEKSVQELRRHLEEAAQKAAQEPDEAGPGDAEQTDRAHGS